MICFFFVFRVLRQDSSLKGKVGGKTGWHPVGAFELRHNDAAGLAQKAGAVDAFRIVKVPSNSLFSARTLLYLGYKAKHYYLSAVPFLIWSSSQPLAKTSKQDNGGKT